MQNRMKEHQLKKEQINELLETLAVGHFSTIGTDGYPYTCPVHFVYLDGKIYFHGLPKGQKLDNLMKNNKVCFEACMMKDFILDENPCDVNTAYESVIIKGEASLVSEHKKKEEILVEIVAKYTPHLADKKLPENMVKGTAVIELVTKECTGKFYE